MNFQFTKTRFLICEGEDDKGFLESLIRDRGLPEFQVCHAAECNMGGSDGRGVGGRSGFRFSLSGFKPLKGYREVKGILIVTDNDKPGSFDEVRNALVVNGHTAPATPTETGVIDGKPVAVLMLPSHTEPGDLEKLCFPEIARTWPQAEKCVAAFMTCTGAVGWKKESSYNKARARCAMVGFNEDDPYKGIGHLFRSGTLSTANSCFDSTAEFLQSFDAMIGI